MRGAIFTMILWAAPLLAGGPVLAASAIEQRIDDLKSQLAQRPDDQPALRELLVIYVVDRDDPKSARRYSSDVEDEVWRECVLLAARDITELAPDDLLTTARWYRGLAGKAKGAARIAMYRRSRGYFERFLTVAKPGDDRRADAEGSLRGVVAMIHSLERVAANSQKPGKPPKPTRTSASASEDLDKELVLHWTFEPADGADEVIADRSGREHDGRLDSGKVVEGPRGRALDGRVVLADTPKLRHDGSYTLAAWVYLPSLTQPVAIIEKGQGGPARQYALAVEGAILRPTTVVGASGRTVAGDLALPAESWTHLIVTHRHDGRQTHVRFYRDGLPLGEPLPPVPGRTTNAAASLTIGAAGVQLDDVRIYHRSITDAQAQSLFRLDAMPRRGEPQEGPASVAANEPLWDDDSEPSADAEPENAASSSSFFGIPIK